MSDLISDHLTALRAESLSPLTITSRERLLNALDRELPYGVDVASTQELQAWLGRRGWVTKTRETYWCHMTGFYRWAVQVGRLDWDPSADLKRPRPKARLPRVASDAQLHRCLRELDRPVLRAVILAGGAGMRAGEIAKADRDHFDADRVLILGKGDKGRVVPLLDDVWDEVRNCPAGPLITNHGDRVSSAWVTQVCAKAFHRIGEPRLTIHWFRGAFATRLRRMGVDTAAIARLLGHESVATTQQYLQFEDADLAAAMRRLPHLAEAARRDVEPEPAVTRLGPTTEAA